MRTIVALLVLLGVACSAPAPTSSAKPAAGTAAAVGAAAAPTAALAPIGAVASAPTAPAAPVERQEVKYGYNRILSGLVMFVAQERGYLAEQGLDVEFIPFDSGALMIAPAAAGQLDIIAAVGSPGLFNALARDLPLTAVAATSLSTDTTLLLRPDLAESGRIRNLTDLRGMRVSFNVEGSPNDYILRQMFLTQGVHTSELEVLRLPSTDLGPALVNGAVEAGVTVEPLATSIVNQGIGVPFLNSRGIVEKYLSGTITIGPSMKARGDAVTTRLLVAYQLALRDALAALENDRVVEPSVLQIVTKWTGIPPETVALVPFSGVPPQGRIDPADLDRQQSFWIQEGLVPQRADMQKFVEMRYLDAALAQLR
jgi:NitT/TauT family transport system substrate-binding protein